MRWVIREGWWAPLLVAAGILLFSTLLVGTLTDRIGDDTADDCPVSAVEHCGCEGVCSHCHHLCLECRCGSHIIDRGVKCQEMAACEAGCSG